MKAWEKHVVETALASFATFKAVGIQRLISGSQEDKGVDYREAAEKISLEVTLGCNGRKEIFHEMEMLLNAGASHQEIFKLISFCQECGRKIEKERMVCLGVAVKCCACTKGQ